jgi:perosamine synthetase
MPSNGEPAESYIPLVIPDLSGREREYLNQCIDDNFVSSVGPFVGKFEEGIAARMGARHGVSTSSGTTALHLALTALGVRHGDLVICPSFTFIASANAISHAGAKPWLVDIDLESWAMDPGHLDEQLSSSTERRDGKLVYTATGARVAAIMPVHTLGTTPDLDPILATAREYGLPVVADAACAIGVEYRGSSIAAMADLSAISFNGNKTITTGGGGMVVGNDDALMARVRHLCTTARRGRDYDHDEIGFNYRMTNICAAVGLAQLERVDELVERKRAIRRRYEEAFSGINWLERFPAPGWADSTCWISGVVLTPDAPLNAMDVIDALQVERIEARPFWKPVHLQVPYADCPRGPLSVTNDLWQRIVTLPCSTGLTDADQERVIAKVLSLS